MKNNKPTFSVLNDFTDEEYPDGEGIFLHFGDTRVKIGESLEDLDILMDRIKFIRNEIKQNYKF